MEDVKDKLNIERPASIEDAAEYIGESTDNFYSSLFNATLYAQGEFMRVNVEMLHWSENSVGAFV